MDIVNPNLLSRNPGMIKRSGKWQDIPERL
jgi:hypothetical protein